MKNIILITCAFLGFTMFAQAQDISKNAIGLRLGDANGFGASISYQRAIMETNRIEANFGWSDGNDDDGIKLIGLYEWVWNLDGNFNWYAGPGAGFASYASAIVTGVAGIEYHFDFPLLISLDVRPEFGFDDDEDNLKFDVGLSARYQF